MKLPNEPASSARRQFLGQAGTLAAAGLLPLADAAQAATTPAPASGFWPGDARLVISISMQFEAGGQPLKGTDSPFPKVDFPASVPQDYTANTVTLYCGHMCYCFEHAYRLNEQKLLNKDTNELFIKNEPSINENKLNKMTKVKLIEHAQSLNITIDMSKMLKIKIIELIMNKNNI